ncbi:hypothetical protein [Noviherbaspirillum saxi]|uniref:Uncharacterized protein n=1 Tax=Noviherbaspirillum saxi TaxID=2320863 RepID=A0A3A3FQ23_9BURK|nr:hypothetical protein [Noviherbaspirillum saxi]RJF98302.1 hypothetical protein D3871_07080 [Noviherbaspirillum saxi]
MITKIFQGLAICALLASSPMLAAQDESFSFVVLSHIIRSPSDEATLRDAIDTSDADNLAFVVANGIKSVSEPCTDMLYNRRKAMLQEAKNGLIVSLTASDWAECKQANGKSAAVGKLTLLRDVFFQDEFSIGGSKIPVVRQSTIAKFRDFAENARWEVGNTMFATLNLPRNNNHFVLDAGRNSEFEDRLIANRDWLNRVFTYATRRKLDGIVLFCDGNPMAVPKSGTVRRDGYAETRKQIKMLASKFDGKVLIIHSQSAPSTQPAAPADIVWQKNIGELDAGSGSVKLTVNQAHGDLFSVTSHPLQASGSSR